MKEEAKLLVNLEYEERIIEQKNIAKRGTSLSSAAARRTWYTVSISPTRSLSTCQMSVN